MNESFDQQAGHKPSPPTGSRQAAQSLGSATSTASPNADRSAPATRPKRRGGASAAAVSPCMSGRYRARPSPSTATPGTGFNSYRGMYRPEACSVRSLSPSELGFTRVRQFERPKSDISGGRGLG